MILQFRPVGAASDVAGNYALESLTGFQVLPPGVFPTNSEEFASGAVVKLSW